MDGPAERTTHNRIAEGAVVSGGVVQAGTFTGQVHFHYRGRTAPLDLLTLRRWIDRIAADHRERAEADRGHAERVSSVRAALDDEAAEEQRDVVRRLLVAGVCGYLAHAGDESPPRLPEQVLLDVVVFALWPVVTARKLPRDWQGQLAEITSPRLAALVERTRRSGGAAEEFARAVARRSLYPAMSALFDDLADPRRGGALLTSMALVGGLPKPSTGHARTVLSWVVGVAGGAAALAAVLDRESHVQQMFEEAVTDLPDGSSAIDATEVLSDFLDGLFD